MAQIDAIFQGGVFKPLEEVSLPENQKVRLSIQPVERKEEILAWLEKVQQLQKRIIERSGFLPDSTPDIAADRMGDV